MPSPSPSSEFPSDGLPAPVFDPEDLARVYDDLRRLAHALLQDERQDHTLEATALVHEAISKLMAEAGHGALGSAADVDVAARRRILFAAISRRMRQVLVDYARRHRALKGPGAWPRSALHDAIVAIDRKRIDVVALDEALERLRRADPDAAEVFQHHWFGGLSMEQVALVLDTSVEAVQVSWTRGRRTLQEWLRGMSRSGA